MRALNRLFTRLLNTTRHGGDARIGEETESHRVREDCHTEGGLPFVENLLLDVRYALRV